MNLKKKIFSIIFSVIFVFAIFAGVNYSKDKSSQSLLYVVEAVSEDGSTPPTTEILEGYDEVSSKDASGNGWFYNGEGYLELINVNWSSPLVLADGFPMTIKLIGENKITVETGFALNLNSCYSVEFDGMGSLELVTNDSSDSVSVVLCSDEPIDLGAGLKVCIDACAECKTSVSASDFTAVKSVKIFGQHKHENEVFASGNVLTVKCSVDGCSYGMDGYSEELTVDDVDCGETPTPIFDLEGLKSKTGINLTESDFIYQYYRESEDGDELVANPAEIAGNYYLVLTTKADCEIGEKTLVCSFVVNKLKTEITAENGSIKYNGTRYNLDHLFEFCTNAGSKTYTIITGGSTASGVIEENELIITRAGVLNIKVETTGQGNYAGSEAEAVLVIEKGDLNVGEGVNQLRIAIFEDDKLEVEYPKWWLEKESDTVVVVVRNNTSGGVETLTYWLDKDCLSDPTTTDHGASAVNGKPSVMGLYYVKAQIAETGLYNGVTLTQKVEVKRLVEVEVNEEATMIGYASLVDNKYDVSKMFRVDEDYVDSINGVEYYLVENDDSILIDEALLEISSIGGGYPEDRYVIMVVMHPKDDSLCVFTGQSAVLKVYKSDLDVTKLGVKDLVYGETELELDIQDNPYNGDVQVRYFYDEQCTNPIVITDQLLLNAGTYYAEIIIGETDFTAETQTITSFKVNKKPVEIIWQEDNFTYNGEVQEIYAQYLDIDKTPVKLSVTTDKEFKKVQFAGQNYSYQAVASFMNGETNYELVGDLTCAYHIKPADVEVEFVGDSVKDYGESILLMNVRVVSGEFFEELNYRMFKYTATLNDQPVEINATMAVGVYLIAGEGNDSNYNISFTNTANLHVKNKFISLSIEDWTWGEPASVPSSEVAYGEVEYIYYLGGFENGVFLGSDIPTEPGEYTVVAQVNNNQGVYGAFDSRGFKIHKVVVSLPEKDSTVYVYDGMEKTYHIDESQAAGLYTISKRTFVNAGNYRIQLTLTDVEHYKWGVSDDAVCELEFVINKKPVEKPVEDNRKFKYNGNPLTYNVNPSLYYTISQNTTQVEAGIYDIRISLISNNYMWIDGSSDDIVYKFIINKSKIEDPAITDAAGNVIDSDEVSIISVGGFGLNPEDELSVKIITAKDSDAINEVKKQLQSQLNKYGKIFKVADIKLIRSGTSVQPDNVITLKISVPKELINTEFELYHIHDENGVETITKIDYTDVDEEGYITIQTETLSSFVFVYDQTSLVVPIVIFAILSAVLAVLLVLQLKKFKNRKKNSVLVSAVPVFYVFGELLSTIVLGIVFGLLVIANIVFLILNLKQKKQKESVKRVKVKADK